MNYLAMIFGTLVASGLLLGLALLVVFIHLTSGASGLRQRIERLFRLPERARDRAHDHYYQAYWHAR